MQVPHITLKCTTELYNHGQVKTTNSYLYASKLTPIAIRRFIDISPQTILLKATKRHHRSLPKKQEEAIHFPHYPTTIYIYIYASREEGLHSIYSNSVGGAASYRLSAARDFFFSGTHELSLSRAHRAYQRA